MGLAATALSSLTTDTDFEEFYRRALLYEIEWRTSGPTSLSSGDWEEIQEIATLCSWEGGKAAAIAQALCATARDSIVEPLVVCTGVKPGLYYACLTVSNEYSADTSCQWVEIESVSTDDTPKEEVFIVHPNPFSDYIEITPPDRGFHYRTLHVTIIDIHGRVIASPEMTCPCRLKLGSIPDGVYFYTIKEGGRNVGSGKILKLDQR